MRTSKLSSIERHLFSGMKILAWSFVARPIYMNISNAKIDKLRKRWIQQGRRLSACGLSWLRQEQGRKDFSRWVQTGDDKKVKYVHKYQILSSQSPILNVPSQITKGSPNKGQPQSNCLLRIKFEIMTTILYYSTMSKRQIESMVKAADLDGNGWVDILSRYLE